MATDILGHIAGPCTVTVTAEGGAGDYLSLAEVLEGIDISANPEWIPITNDGWGQTPITQLFSGMTVTVEFTGIEPSSKFFLGGVLGDLEGGDLEIGTLISTVARKLKITERDGTSIWIADKAILVDPNSLMLQSTQEIQLPLSAILLPDDNGDFFSTLPSYIWESA